MEKLISNKKTKKTPFCYEIKTYKGEELVNKTIVYLSKPDLNTYDDDVPISMGSNQTLTYLD